ncbi:MAG: TIR domain-containing protein [Acidimicrobiales bacterium]
MNEKYDAFISYAHSADALLAPKLQEGLQQFAKPWNKRRALRVFRDEASLSANPDLWSSIETALLGSRWLILLASQPSASSPWVDREVAAWCQHKPPENILIALTDGDIRWSSGAGTFDLAGTSSLPSAARLALRVEPRVVDLRWTRGEQAAALTLRDQRFAAAVADLAAPLHNVPKDELIGEDRRQHIKLTRWRRATFAGLAVLTIVSLIATFFAFGQRDQARERADIAQSRQLAAQSADVTEQSPALGALLAIEAYRKNHTPEAYAALLTIAGRPSIDRVLHGEPVEGTGIAVTLDPGAAAYSPDGHSVAASGLRGDITVWDLDSGRAIFALRTSAYTSQLAFSGNDRLITYDRGTAYSTWDLRTGTMVNQTLNPPDGVMSANGSTIVAFAKASAEVSIWKATTRASVRVALPAAVAAAGVRADGAEVAAIAGGRLQIFDSAGKPLRSVAAPAFTVYPALSVSDDGRTAALFSQRASGSRDPVTVALVDTTTGTTTTVVSSLDFFSTARFSPDGKRLALTDGSSMQIIDGPTKTVMADPLDVPSGPLGLAFDSSGSRVLVPGRSGDSFVIDVGGRQTLVTPLATRGAIAASNPDRTRFAVLSDRSVTIIDGASGDPVGPSIALDALAKNEARSVAISASGNAVAVMTNDHLTAYSVASGSALGPAVRVDCGMTNAFTFDGRTARIFHAPGVVTLVDVEGGRQRHDKPCPPKILDGASVDGTGRYVVFAENIDNGASTKLTLWDVERDRTISDKLAVFGDGEYAGPAVSPGGRFVLAGMTVRFVTRVFDLENDPPTIGVLDQMAFPSAASFSDDGSVLAWATGTELIVFDVEHHRRLGTVANLPGDFADGVLGPKGETAIAVPYPTGSADLVMVDLRPSSIIAVACRMANRNLTDEEQLFYLGSVTRRATCPDLPREPRSLQPRTDIPVISAAIVTTTTTTTTRAAATTTRAAATTTRSAATTTRSAATTR